MQYPFTTVDVFTRQRFGGNPLAVVLDADTLSDTEMQAIAREFNYSETTFVMRPEDDHNTANVRIFTPACEVPFAGHPNVGTAHVLASRAGAKARPECFVFEEKAGLVPVSIAWEGDAVETVELTAPVTLSTGSPFDAEAVAASLSLETAAIRVDRHPPLIASVGLPFLVVEIAGRAALAAARVDIGAISKLLPAEGADAIYLYCRELWEDDGDVDFTARMFAPWDGVAEDPATGSATGAACSLIADLTPEPHSPRRFRVAQGVDMKRPSRLDVRTGEPDGLVRIGGSCVPVMSGFIEV
ncbi:MAG: PhzF family phenazine biosynthesis protein [Hoeflea sp.]|uniref:PhzF family phenazine biosynthesis protein n=1 Tax=Hoeflea sp. TaxID=1940281 RepID=UPI0032EEA038